MLVCYSSDSLSLRTWRTHRQKQEWRWKRILGLTLHVCWNCDQSTEQSSIHCVVHVHWSITLVGLVMAVLGWCFLVLTPPRNQVCCYRYTDWFINLTIYSNKMDLFGWMTVLVFCFLASVISVGASEHKCTFIKAKTITKFEQVYKPCKLSYRARCSWFSLDYCTFYHEQYCNKNFNTSEIVYVKVIECCNKYVMAPNGTCVLLSKVENDDWYIMKLNATTEPPVVVKPIDHKPVKNAQSGDYDTIDSRDPSKVSRVETKESSTMTLSHGAYAGIGCALLFLGIIGVLTFIGVRKRRRRFAAQKSSSEQRVPIHMATEEIAET